MTLADSLIVPERSWSPPRSSFMALASLDQAALDALPQAVYLCAGDGRVVRFNDRAAELWGRAPHLDDPNELFCGSFRLYRTDGTFLPHEECPMAAALRRPARSFLRPRRWWSNGPTASGCTVLVSIAATSRPAG